ncbi:MAG: TRAM domain-containing protein, partial [Vicinamibacteria bacterium]
MAELEIDIEKIVAGGDGLARHEGRVVFVPGTAPGERHRVRVQKQKKDYVKAISVERIETSPDRRSPPCPYYKSCGGCSLMHLKPEAQLEAKIGILREGLARAFQAPYEGPFTVNSNAELH